MRRLQQHKWTISVVQSAETKNNSTSFTSSSCRIASGVKELKKRVQAMYPILSSMPSQTLYALNILKQDLAPFVGLRVNIVNTVFFKIV